MSFPKACQKETWFFNELFADDPETRKLCGIENFRGKVVELYESFVAHQIRKAAPKIFTKVSMYGQHMETEWAWKPQQESYEDKKLMMGQLNEMIHEMISIGSKETSLPVTLAEILMREDVVDVIKNLPVFRSWFSCLPDCFSRPGRRRPPNLSRQDDDVSTKKCCVPRAHTAKM